MDRELRLGPHRHLRVRHLVRGRAHDDAVDGRHAGHPDRALRGRRSGRRDLVAEGVARHAAAAAQEHRARPDHLGDRVVPRVQPVLHPHRGRPGHVHPAGRHVDLRGGVCAVPPRLRDRGRDRAGCGHRDHQRRPVLLASRRRQPAGQAMTATSRAYAPRAAGRSSTPGSRGRGRDLSRTGFALYVTGGTLAALVFLVPLAWAILRSFLPEHLVTQAPTAGDFSHLTTANYSGLIQTNDILRYAANSLVVAVVTGLLTAVIATMAGYGFARFRFPGSGVVFALVLVTMMIPFQSLLTPLFLEMHSLGLTNNLAGLALFYTTFNLPFGVFVM